MLETLDFPVSPANRKYLNQHLGAEMYVLSTADRFGKMLYHLLRRQIKGKQHHAEARASYTAVLKLDMHNFPVHQYGLTELTNYSIFQFNDFVDELMKEELFWWIGKFLNRSTTIREIILDFMGAYDLLEEDIQYETLRKAVQRKVNLPPLKKRRAKSVGSLSQKTAELSRKTADLSQKEAALSRRNQHRAVREELMTSPFGLTELIRQHGAAVR